MATYHELIKAFAGVSAFVAVSTCATPAPAAPPAWDVMADTWVGVDGRGRTLPTYEDVGPPKPDRTAVMFYYLWLDGRGGTVFDMAKRLAAFPDARVRPGEWWWWGEPVLGYYLNTDPFVHRVHASQLSDAGIDAVAFDSTNGFTHEPEYLSLLKVYSDMRAVGLHTPAIAHVTNHETGKTSQKLYDEFYGKGWYKDLWFNWQGKPLLMADPAKVPAGIRDFFTLRRSWAYHDPEGWFGDGRDRWPWLDHFPQQYGWHEDAGTPEQLSVSVAQHAHSLIGRNKTATRKSPIDGTSDAGAGLYFEEQWSTVHKVNPPVVFITNYNEWYAKAYADSPKRVFIGKPMQPGEGFFVDEYDPEFSRDIEPAMPTPENRGVEDNYYYQLVAHLRRYKGVRPLPPVLAKPIAIDGRFDDWQNVTPEFRDTTGDPVARDYPGFDPATRYVNKTGRNDIVAAKVSHDATNVYFMVECAKPITKRNEDDWMVLYLNTDGDYKTGWLGYDYCVSHTSVAVATTSLDQNVGNAYRWRQTSDDIAYAVNGNRMEIALPRELLGDRPLRAIDFKWADRCTDRRDWTDFTRNGDAAPNGRLNYRAKLAPPR